MILAITGTFGVLGLSSIINKSAFKKAFFFFSRNSLRIMILHSYLMIPGMIDVVLMKFNFSNKINIVYSVKSILLLTIVSCICLLAEYAKKRIDRILCYIGR